MNPDNNTLERTYFIGGAPRIGKSILAYALAERINGHVVSTEGIKNAAKKACADKENDLFAVNKLGDLPDNEWLEMHLEHPRKVVDIQNSESIALWPSLVSFCNSFVEDDKIHIVEGVALIPKLVSEMKHQPKHVAFIGNTSDQHLEAIKKYMRDFPHHDWMASMEYSEEKLHGMSNYIKEMSLYIKKEAEKYNFPYYEIEDQDFEKSIENVLENLKSKLV